MKPSVAGLVMLFAAASVFSAQPPASVATMAETPPTTAEVIFQTRPLVKYRLRLPESLENLTVTQVRPLVDDTTRFAVRLRFRAKTPFGGMTEHEAQFVMKRGVNPGIWIVTAE